MKIIILIFLSILLSSCTQKVKETSQNSNKEEKSINYPEGIPGNYITLSDTNARKLKLKEKLLKKTQFYTSSDIDIDLYIKNMNQNNSKKNQIANTDTFTVNIRKIIIKKFMPCVILNAEFVKYNSEEGLSLVGCDVDFGDDVILYYRADRFKRFSGILKYKDVKIKNIERAIFRLNASILFRFEEPLVKYQDKDTVLVNGKKIK